MVPTKPIWWMLNYVNMVTFLPLAPGFGFYQVSGFYYGSICVDGLQKQRYFLIPTEGILPYAHCRWQHVNHQQNAAPVKSTLLIEQSQIVETYHSTCIAIDRHKICQMIYDLKIWNKYCPVCVYILSIFAITIVDDIWLVYKNQPCIKKTQPETQCSQRNHLFSVLGNSENCYDRWGQATWPQYHQMEHHVKMHASGQLKVEAHAFLFSHI